MTAKRKPDTFGWHDPDMIERRRHDVAEYDSYLPKIQGNGRTGSTKVKHPTVLPTAPIHHNRTPEGS